MKFKLKDQPVLKRQEELDRKKKLLKKISLIFLFSITILILWIALFKNRIYIKRYENNYLSFNYDTTWTLNINEDNYIGFTNKTNGIVNIKISNINTKDLNNNIESIVDEVRFDIESQNTNYNLLKEEKKNISNNNYEAYKLLYEDGDNQCLVIIIKNNNNLFVINYISNNDTFDIVLDSFQTFLSTLELK